MSLCGGGLRGWSILTSDDQRGVIEAVSRALLSRREDDIRVEITLDENAQTRVDLWSASQRNRTNMGRNRRIIGRFLRRLDRKLQATPEQILDPTLPPAWLEKDLTKAPAIASVALTPHRMRRRRASTGDG